MRKGVFKDCEDVAIFYLSFVWNAPNDVVLKTSEENLYWYFGTTKLTTDEEIQANGTSISSKDEIPNSLNLVDPRHDVYHQREGCA